jgi:hypothetical protein
MSHETFDGFVMLVQHLHLHARQDDLGVGDTAGSPFAEQMAGFGEASGLGDNLGLARPRADEQD